jgi:hypothetical protein
LFAYGTLKNIFKVIYAPQKALNEIIQNPKYIGPVMIMILFTVANVGFGYVLLSKSYVDQTIPNSSEFDKWTEDTNFWNSNATIILNTHDYINGSYYGNKSIEFFSVASSQIWMQLNMSDSLNCSGSEGYKSLSFRLKQIEPSTKPSNVSLYLLSAKPQYNFYHNLTNESNKTDLWNKITVSLGPESEDWQPSNTNADWSNITGLKFEFTWPTESNITLLIDGLFFHGFYKSAIDSVGGFLISLGNPYSPINTFMQFAVQWVILGGLLYIIPKMFGVKTVWKPLLIVAGFVLITYFIRMIVFTVVFVASPEIRYSLEYLGGVPGEWETASAQVFQAMSISYQILWYIDKLVWVWTIALCAIALRLMFTISWAKSFIISTSSYLFYIILLLFLAPGAVLL